MKLYQARSCELAQKFLTITTVASVLTFGNLASSAELESEYRSTSSPAQSALSGAAAVGALHEFSLWKNRSVDQVSAPTLQRQRLQEVAFREASAPPVRSVWFDQAPSANSDPRRALSEVKPNEHVFLKVQLTESEARKLILEKASMFNPDYVRKGHGSFEGDLDAYKRAKSGNLLPGDLIHDLELNQGPHYKPTAKAAEIIDHLRANGGRVLRVESSPLTSGEEFAQRLNGRAQAVMPKTTQPSRGILRKFPLLNGFILGTAAVNEYFNGTVTETLRETIHGKKGQQ